MDESKSERNLEQTSLTPGKKILWIVAPKDEKRISGDLPRQRQHRERHYDGI